MDMLPRIWVDWNEISQPDLVALDHPDTIDSFRMHGVPIEEGQHIRCYGEELEADAVIVKVDRGGACSLRGKIIVGTLVMIHHP